MLEEFVCVCMCVCVCVCVCMCVCVWSHDLKEVRGDGGVGVMVGWE